MQQPIAIVGMACRFPKARDLAEYWDLLAGGVDAVTETPRARWDAVQIDEPASSNRVTRWGGFIDDCDKFDADFFRISPEEARRIDPQQRLMLELTWSGLEDAGIAPASLSGRRVGVFVGASHSDYERLIYRELGGLTGYEGPGAYHSIIANRVSYFLNLKGPSMVVDTACSSALSALHVAIQALRAGDCELAIVAGSSLNLTPEETMSLSLAKMLSPTGRVRAFDDGADGFVRGEGLGVLVLALPCHAQQLGLRVRAKVLASVVNQDGASNGLMAPNAIAQRSLLQDALERAELTVDDVDYVEAHGTGTALGDSIELSALNDVFGSKRTSVLPVGSVKTNIGHLEAASGVASVIKVALAMDKRLIPKQLHFTRPNRYVDLEAAAISICSEARPWPARGGRRRAGVSTFGFGGTNAHVILEHEEQLEADPRHECGGDRVLALSARTITALRALACRLADYLRTHDVDLDDLCYTMAVGRNHFPVRTALVFHTRTELQQKLAALSDGMRTARTTKARKLGFWLEDADHAAPDSAAWPKGYRDAALASIRDDPEAIGLAHARGLLQMLGEWGVKPVALHGVGNEAFSALRLATEGAEALEAKVASAADARQAFRAARCDLLLQLGSAEPLLDCETIVGAMHPAKRAEMAAALYASGINLQWRSYYDGRSFRLVSLPTYPFESARHWVAPVNHPDEERLRGASLGASLVESQSSLGSS